MIEIIELFLVELKVRIGVIRFPETNEHFLQETSSFKQSLESFRKHQRTVLKKHMVTIYLPPKTCAEMNGLKLQNARQTWPQS